jgi:hypothetical protein
MQGGNLYATWYKNVFVKEDNNGMQKTGTS